MNRAMTHYFTNILAELLDSIIQTRESTRIFQFDIRINLWLSITSTDCISVFVFGNDMFEN